MSVTVGRESFFWHKLHSLSGIVPVGFYLLQHLLLNSFSLAGPDSYNGVSGFFYSIPEHVLLAIEIIVIWVPLAFHAVYGLFITGRGDVNSYFTTRYKWPRGRMYTLQRYSGIFLFFFLCYHVASTTIQVKFHGTESVDFQHMRMILSDHFYFFLVIYALGVLAASYHFSYGVWNFCIRWGISISDRAQTAVQKFSLGMFIAVTLLGWAALGGFFLNHSGSSSTQVDQVTTMKGTDGHPGLRPVADEDKPRPQVPSLHGNAHSRNHLV